MRLSLPLMAGVSLVTADTWIIAHFASRHERRNLADDLRQAAFTAPMAMLAQAAGAASMPFFASLWAKEKRFEFATVVADSVSRVACLGLLAASAMAALGSAAGRPALHRRAFFSGGCAASAPPTLPSFRFRMFLWSAQAIYSRAFYAAGNTFVPMVAGTIVTVVSLPIYASFFHWHGAMGLAIASDIGHRHADADDRAPAASAAHGFAGQPGLCRDGPVPAGRSRQRRRRLGGLLLAGGIGRAGALGRRCTGA